MSQECGNVGAFMSANYRAFRPYAYFDKHMDAIRVRLADCSVTEKRLNRYFTLLVPNDPQRGGRAVGVTVKGVNYLFDQCGLPVSGVHSLAEIINAIVKMFPDMAASRVQEELASQLEKLSVNFDEEVANAA